jgi:hypothetical protein
MAPYNNDAPQSEAEADEIRREAARHGLTVTKYLMMKAAPTDVVQSIVWDHVGKADVTRPSSMASTPSSRPVEHGSGWAPERPIRPPEGIEHIDRMIEAQTAKERLQAVVEAIEANEAIKRAAQRDKKG